MALLSISFANLHNGQEVVLPIDVTGSITVPVGAIANTSISAASRQIDDNGLVAFANVSGTSFPFNFEVTVADCPDVNVWYMASVYAWDNAGDCTTQSVTFKRIAAPGPPSLPPSGGPPGPPGP